MVASKLVDAMARLPGYIGENADARKAYTQALLKDHEGSTETWIEIEESQWPKEWKGKYIRPVVRLLRNL